MGLVQLLVLVVVVTVALAALSSTFTTIFANAPEEDGDDGIESGDMSLDFWPSDFQELFTIHQVGTQSYMRCDVLLDYDDGRWLWEKGETEAYKIGYWIGDAPFRNEYATIKPLVDWKGDLPIFKDTRYLAWESNTPMDWNPSWEVMSPREVVDSSYTIRYLGYPVNSLEELRGATVTADPQYLSIPEDIAGYIGELAQAYAAGMDTPYDQALAIRDHIRSDNNYTFNISSPPDDIDPIYWFLFSSHEGVCTHFNSAMVMMARSLGIPARMVNGYLINSNLEYQTVYAKQAHAYAEILLDGIGWVVMDATPLAPPDTYGEETVSDFRIEGKVFQDQNYNGVLDSYEEDNGLADALVRISGPNGISKDLRTNANGDFSYTAPSVGNYTIYAMVEERWMPIYDQVWTVTIGSSEIPALNFAFVPTNGISTDDIYRMELVELHGGTVQNRSDHWTVDCSLLDTNGAAVVSSRIYAYLDPLDGSGERRLIGQTIGPYGTVLTNGTIRMDCVLPDDIDVGNYSLVVRYGGGADAAPSEDSVEVRVMGNVLVSMNVPRFVMPNAFEVVSIHVYDASTGEEISPVNVTFDLGLGWETSTTIGGSPGAQVLFMSDTLGRYDMVCRFAGNLLYLPGEGTATCNVVYPHLVMPLPDLVRGRNNNLYGRMLLGDIPVPGAEVDLEIVGVIAQTLVCDSHGEISFNIQVSEDMTLGEYNVTIISDNYQTNDTIAVVSTTELTLVQENGRLIANLTDDHGAPLVGANVTIQYDEVSLTVMTGEDGSVIIEPKTNAPVNCRATFEGNVTLLSSFGNVTYVPVVEASQWIWVPVVLLGVTLSAATIWYSRRRRRKVPASMVASKKVEVPDGLLVKGPHSLRFPDIEHGMPWVWHGGRMRMKVSTPDPAIVMKVDGAEIPLTVVDGAAEAVLDLEVGRHVVELEGVSGRTVAAVRMVEYRKEVLDLFASSLETWSPSSLVGPQMSPREVFTALGALQTGMAEALGVIERAAYSHYPVARTDYKKVFHALMELGGLNR